MISESLIFEMKLISYQFLISLLKFFHAVHGTEIRVYDIQVRNDDLLMIPGEIQGHIHRNVRLSASVVSAKKRDPFIVHV